ncbi:MAG TPA: hypothetical protein VKY74_24160 [Chloroflexia bacterium]|nr:hypothetical protein [Chloroflexia bacterium]
MKYIVGFFAFWYDFIVGDAWEVAAGVILSLLALYLGIHFLTAGVRDYGAILLPLVIVVLLSYSLWRARGATK